MPLGQDVTILYGKPFFQFTATPKKRSWLFVVLDIGV
jgi:hypothetical protein